jgi:hypothetical protein
LIVKLISSDPSTPVDPPVQAIVTEVDAQGRVQALELAVLRAFDSASSSIELVAESGPLPVRRTSNAKSRPNENRFGLFGPHTLAAAAAFPSSPSPNSPAPSTQTSIGTLRVKLDSFTPYAALFKARAPANFNSQPCSLPSDLKQVTDVRSCAASFSVASPGHGYVVGQELTVSPLNNDTYKCVFEFRMCV